MNITVPAAPSTTDAQEAAKENHHHQRAQTFEQFPLPDNMFNNPVRQLRKVCVLCLFFSVVVHICNYKTLSHVWRRARVTITRNARAAATLRSDIVLQAMYPRKFIPFFI